MPKECMDYDVSQTAVRSLKELKEVKVMVDIGNLHKSNTR